MKHVALFSLILSLLFFAGGTSNGFAVAASKKIGSEEGKPTLLPTNPVYFIKDFWRGTRLFFAGDPVKKAELELRFMEEKLIEARRLSELTDNEQAIERALRIYQSAQIKLQDRVSELKKIGNNPDIERFLEKVADKADQHQRVLDGIFGKLEQLAQDEGNFVETNLWNQKNSRTEELREDIEAMLSAFAELDGVGQEANRRNKERENLEKFETE